MAQWRNRRTRRPLKSEIAGSYPAWVTVVQALVVQWARMPPFQGEEDGSEPSEATVARIKLVNARWTGVRFYHPGLSRHGTPLKHEPQGRWRS